MANQLVPRGTSLAPPVARPLMFRKEMRLAIDQDMKTVTRRVLGTSNCIVTPGTFAGLRLETGRAKHLDVPEGGSRELMRSQVVLRAQCEFDNGRVRVVTVEPKIAPGDLFWLKANRYTARAKSNLTLRVLAIGLSRLQDLTNQDAEDEGVAVLDMPSLAPREAFAWLWDQIHGGGAWAANPWCWSYRFEAVDQNVDRVLSE